MEKIQKAENRITTLEELKKYIGKVVYFYYYRNSNYYPDEDIAYAWMKKITKIEPSNNQHPTNNLRYHLIYGTYMVEMPTKFNKKTKAKTLNNITVSNAQQCARIPTEQEMKQYMQALRKARIFGL